MPFLQINFGIINIHRLCLSTEKNVSEERVPWRTLVLKDTREARVKEGAERGGPRGPAGPSLRVVSEPLQVPACACGLRAPPVRFPSAQGAGSEGQKGLEPGQPAGSADAAHSKSLLFLIYNLHAHSG